ncbi:nucleoside hydrolase [Nitratireductor sp. XY-223]|uniref:nucleoside hydrolase n=1 Tax=Nitratireductor sp. XY-223 TaxID=2561926 RepID=UPI00145B796E|nr:nucleoside hydrolase [Nitratireductor sp. XY-223]
MTHKIIIDTDPGIDDTMAIAYAIAHPDIDLIALTTIFGNVSVTEATDNALALLDYFGHAGDVARGDSRPLVMEPKPHSYFVHGRNGLGEVEIPASARSVVALDAADYLIEKTKEMPGEIDICAVGPLTNLARALERDPSIAERVKSVCIMGGAVYRPGNVSPVAEANIWNDPHAAERVFAADWPVVLAPLDVTTKVVLSPHFFADLEEADPKVGKLLSDMARFYARFYRSHSGINGCIPHDVMALAYLTIPGVYMQKRGALAAVTEGPGIGQTIFNPAGKPTVDPSWGERPQHTALLDIDAGFFAAHYFDTIARRPTDEIGD